MKYQLQSNVAVVSVLILVKPNERTVLQFELIPSRVTNKLGQEEISFHGARLFAYGGDAVDPSIFEKYKFTEQEVLTAFITGETTNPFVEAMLDGALTTDKKGRRALFALSPVQELKVALNDSEGAKTTKTQPAKNC